MLILGVGFQHAILVSDAFSLSVLLGQRRWQAGSLPHDLLFATFSIVRACKHYKLG